MTGTITFQYDEVRLGRWMETQGRGRRHSRHRRRGGDRRRVRESAGAVHRASRRALDPSASRPTGYVDASGDATLSYEAGLDVREPDSPVYGSLNFLIEGYDTRAAEALVIKDVHERLAQRGGAYGLVRHDGFLMHFPGHDFMLANVTHFETPLDPLQTGRMVVEGRDQADNVVRFLRAEFPKIFANARIRTYGNPGIRQTRWIVGRRQLTVDDIRKGDRPADAAARCAWWVELHNAKDLVHWEKFEPDHVVLHPARLHDSRPAPTTSSRPGGAWTATSRRCRPSA